MALDDLGDVGERDGDAARRDRDRDVGDALERARLRVGHHSDDLARLLDASHCAEAEARADALGDVARPEVERGGLVLVEDDLDLAHVAAEHLDARRAGHVRERGAHHVVGGLAQHTRVHVAGHVEGDDRKRAGRHAVDDDVGVGRERAARLADARLDERERAPHVRVGREEERDLGRPADRLRANALHADDRREALLERARHRREEDVRRRATAPRDDDDARELDLGIDAARHLEGTGDSDRDEQRERHSHEARSSPEQREQAAHFLGSAIDVPVASPRT